VQRAGRPKFPEQKMCVRGTGPWSRNWHQINAAHQISFGSGRCFAATTKLSFDIFVSIARLLVNVAVCVSLPRSLLPSRGSQPIVVDCTFTALVSCEATRGFDSRKPHFFAVSWALVAAGEQSTGLLPLDAGRPRGRPIAQPGIAGVQACTPARTGGAAVWARDHSRVRFPKTELLRCFESSRCREGAIHGLPPLDDGRPIAEIWHRVC
jgi:hypothetical protein